MEKLAQTATEPPWHLSADEEVNRSTGFPLPADKTLLLDELKGLRVRNASEHGQKC
jgi:hypothetical protein